MSFSLSTSLLPLLSLPLSPVAIYQACISYLNVDTIELIETRPGTAARQPFEELAHRVMVQRVTAPKKKTESQARQKERIEKRRAKRRAQTRGEKKKKR